MTGSRPEALPCTGLASDSYKRMPSFPRCYQEMKRKGMTKILLWQEYQKEAGQNAFEYRRLCDRYGEWLKSQKRSMRQYHVAREKLFTTSVGRLTVSRIPGCDQVRQLPALEKPGVDFLFSPSGCGERTKQYLYLMG